MNNTQDNITRMVLGYLSRNSDTGDTLEGISKWWLNIEKIDVTVDVVSGVLETLSKEGLIEKQLLPGDTAIYKICSR